MGEMERRENCWRKPEQRCGWGKEIKEEAAGSFLCFQKILAGFYDDPATSTAGRSGNCPLQNR
jgi:hypothetical protein